MNRVKNLANWQKLCVDIVGQKYGGHDKRKATRQNVYIGKTLAGLSLDRSVLVHVQDC